MKTKLLFIPTGATGILQPLDRTVFRALKSKGNSKCIAFHNNSNGMSPSKAESLGILLESWNEIDSFILNKSWDYSNLIDINDFDPVTDPLDANFHSDNSNNDHE